MIKKRSLISIGKFLDDHLAQVFIVPALLCLVMLVLWPILNNFWNSFTNYSLLTSGSPVFIGFKNYIEILSERIFWRSSIHTIVITFGSVTFQLFFGFVLAIALQNITKGREVLRLVLLVPWTFSSIIMAFSWRWMLDKVFGILNYFMVNLGFLSEPIPWFGMKETALGSVVAMNIWFGVPFMMIAIIAGLQAIPEEQYEAGEIEGANFFQKHWHITLPNLKGIIGIMVSLRTIWIFNNFDNVFLTTGGGPITYSYTLPIYIYSTAWSELFMGKAAAISMLCLIILIIMVMGYFKIFKVEEDSN